MQLTGARTSHAFLRWPLSSEYGTHKTVTARFSLGVQVKVLITISVGPSSLGKELVVRFGVLLVHVQGGQDGFRLSGFHYVLYINRKD